MKADQFGHEYWPRPLVTIEQEATGIEREYPQSSENEDKYKIIPLLKQI